MFVEMRSQTVGRKEPADDQHLANGYEDKTVRGDEVVDQVKPEQPGLRTEDEPTQEAADRKYDADIGLNSHL